MKLLMCILFSCLLPFHHAKNWQTPMSECKLESAGAPLPVKTDIADCTAFPCTLYKEANNSLSVAFRAPKYLEQFQASVLAEALGTVINYPLGQENACEGVTNTPCPLAEREYVEYTYSMYILPIFPAIGFTFEFSFLDKEMDNKPFLCFRTEIQLRDMPN